MADINWQEFSGEEFEESRQSFPYLQMLNNSTPEHSGFFITAQNVETCGFSPDQEWIPYRTVFRSGESAEGYRSLLARFLVVRKSPLMMLDRDSGDFLGTFAKQKYDKTTMTLKMRHLVYLVGKSKRLLHESPLVLTTKGAFCGSFGEASRKFRQDINKAFTASTGQNKPRSDKFLSLCVLAVQVKPELKGDKLKSWTCAVDSYGVPTPENWSAYFLGNMLDIKEKILPEFDKYKDFGAIEQQQQQQAPAPDPDEYGYDDF